MLLITIGVIGIIIVAISGFLFYLNGTKNENNDNPFSQSVKIDYATVSRDFVCADGSFISINELDVLYFSKASQAAIKIGFFTPDDKKTVVYSTLFTPEQEQLYGSCKNGEGKSILEAYAMRYYYR